MYLSVLCEKNIISQKMHKCNSNPPVKPVEGGRHFFLFKPMNAPRQPVRGKNCKKVICVKMGNKKKGGVVEKLCLC